MKNYTITVNGSVYDVAVEEKGAYAAAPVYAAPAAVTPAPAAAPTPVAPAPAAAAPTPAPAATGTAGSIKIEAGAQGKLHSIEVSVGQAIKSGDTIVVLEAMKMEIPVVAPADGTVASINVAVGDAIDAGALLATLN